MSVHRMGSAPTRYPYRVLETACINTRTRKDLAVTFKVPTQA